MTLEELKTATNGKETLTNELKSNVTRHCFGEAVMKLIGS